MHTVEDTPWMFFAPDGSLRNSSGDTDPNPFKEGHTYLVVTINGKCTVSIMGNGRLSPVSNHRDQAHPIAAKEIQLPPDVIQHIIDMRREALQDPKYKKSVQNQFAKTWNAIVEQTMCKNIL